MNNRDGSSVALIDAARRDLDYADTLLGRGGDRLVAIVAVACAAKPAPATRRSRFSTAREAADNP